MVRAGSAKFRNDPVPPWAVPAAGVTAAALLGAGIAFAFRSPGLLSVALLTALSVPVLMLAFRGMKRLLLAAIFLDLSISVSVHFFYRPELGELGTLGGLGVSLTTLALAGLYAAWLVELLGARFTATRPRLAGAVWGAAYVGLVAVSALFAADAALASFELALLVEMLLLLIYLVSNVRSRADLVFVITCLFAGLALQSLITILSGVTHRIVDVGLVSNTLDPSYRTGGVWRSGGTFGSPNLVSAYLVLLMVPALAIALTQRRSWLTLLALLGFGAAFMALIVTRSRGGWVAFAVAALIVVVVLALQGKLRARSLLPALLALGLCAPFVLPLIVDRIRSNDAGSLESRDPLATISWHMIKSEPITGVGPNNFAAAAPEHITPDVSRAWFYTVHSKYLLIWAESGPLALLGFVAFVLSALRSAWLVVRRNDPLYGPLALGLGAALCGHLFQAAFDIFNSRPAVQALWTVVALLVLMATFGHAPAGSRTRPGRRSTSPTGVPLDPQRVARWR